MNGQRGHLRFVGGMAYCPQAERRVDLGALHRYGLGAAHRYGQEFVCPGCGVRIEATDHFQRTHRV